MRKTFVQTLRADLPASNRPRAALLHRLRNLGVVPRVARNIVLHHSPREIERHISYMRFAARRVTMSNPAGWFVRSITENWPAPPGFDTSARKTWWSEEHDRDIYR